MTRPSGVQTCSQYQHNFMHLQTPAGLATLDQAFLEYLAAHHAPWQEHLLAYRAGSTHFTPQELSAFLIDMAPMLEAFLAQYFAIEAAVSQYQAKQRSHDPILSFKQQYVHKRAKRQLKDIDTFDDFSVLHAWLLAQLPPDSEKDLELAVAKQGMAWLEQGEVAQEAITRLVMWCARALTDPSGQALTQQWVCMHLPQKRDAQALVKLYAVPQDIQGRKQSDSKQFRAREGFALTDPRMPTRAVQAQADYCVYCHEQAGDFCSKGFPVKKSQPELGFKQDAFDEALLGCPLEEKISEMIWLYRQAHPIAALAMVMIDNPMCPATGHRVCNDCMKSCVYQKQDPVDIPQIETRVLDDVLHLPWGVEIYDLLTRWHPLRTQQWQAKPYNGRHVAVVGMGPAGFTLAHHLLMEGCAVVGLDGLKIEPLPQVLQNQPVRDYQMLEERLDQRVMAGFGGVAEYGITARWDKNFLKLIYLTLARRPHFQLFGNMRLGGSLTLDDFWPLGFDHVAIAVGAGLPKELPIANSLAPGMRQASDFLMSLQLTGAAQADGLTSMQVRLPAVVIGGGLTAVDTATEIQAYYLKQVEVIAARYNKLVQWQGVQWLRSQFSAYDLSIIDTYLEHAQQIADLRAKQGKQVNFLPLLRQWGGVTIVYRRRLQDSPAYKRNHEEVQKALEEGIYYLENHQPVAVEVDMQGEVCGLTCQVVGQEQVVELPARAILVATGAKPNVAYSFEHRTHIKRQGFQYVAHRIDASGDLEAVSDDLHVKSPKVGMLTSYKQDDHRVSFIGDCHPVFHGSVVKAIASGMRAYPQVMAALPKVETSLADAHYQQVARDIDQYMQAKIVSVVRLNHQVVELIVHAPLACKNAQPGQFYRLQRFDQDIQRVGDTRLYAQALSLVAFSYDQVANTLTFMVVEEGAGNRLCATFKPGDAVALMGPTGVRSSLHIQPSPLCIVSDLRGLASACITAAAHRASGHKVVIIACIERAEDAYCHVALQASCDQLIWLTQSGAAVSMEGEREGDASYGEEDQVNIEAVLSGATTPDLMIARDASAQIMLLGSTELIRRVQGVFGEAKDKQLAPRLLASIHGPMQCMMKGVCAQCLQWRVDPQTGQRTKAVFACSWQHQKVDEVDLDHVDERLRQNHAYEQLNDLWLSYIFAQHEVVRV